MAGAISMIEGAIHRNKMQPLNVSDDDGAVWIIPTTSIVAGRVIDPQRRSGERTVGFLFDPGGPRSAPTAPPRDRQTGQVQVGSGAAVRLSGGA